MPGLAFAILKYSLLEALDCNVGPLYSPFGEAVARAFSLSVFIVCDLGDVRMILFNIYSRTKFYATIIFLY